MSFASVYPLYVNKAIKKGRIKQEVDDVIMWLTGYSASQLQKVIEAELDFTAFFDQAPQMNPDIRPIEVCVCGVRVEDVSCSLLAGFYAERNAKTNGSLSVRIIPVEDNPMQAFS